MFSLLKKIIRKDPEGKKKRERELRGDWIIYNIDDESLTFAECSNCGFELNERNLMLLPARCERCGALLEYIATEDEI